MLVERYPTARRFVPALCRTVAFDATAEAEPVLAALRQLPELMEAKATRRVPAGYLDAGAVIAGVVPAGWWRSLVLPGGRPPATVHRAAYVLCGLEQFHQRLRRQDIFAVASSRWADPSARLLSGPAWEAARDPVLTRYSCPPTPPKLLEAHSRELDAAWQHAPRHVEAGNADVDAEGRSTPAASTPWRSAVARGAPSPL